MSAFGPRFRAALLLSLLVCGCSENATLLPPESRPDVAAKANSPASYSVVCDRVLDDFSSSTVGQFPNGWRTRDEDDMPLALSERLYVVERDGNRNVLHAHYAKKYVTIGRPTPEWNLGQYPILQWEWKAVELPTNARETVAERDDAAAAVYAIWRIGFPFQIDGIKYTWSSSLPIGTRATKRWGHDNIVVVESGRTHLGSFQRVRVDVRWDQQELLHRNDARSPQAIAVLTDADETNSSAEAYYADFRLCRKVQSSNKD